MGHLIVAILLGLLAYFIAAAFITGPKWVHALIGVAVALIVYYGVGVLL